MNRRDFLRRSSVTGLGLTLAGLSRPFVRTAHACATDYKALVCIYLGGGMDNHDTIFPYDQAAYREYARIRRDFLSAYATPRDRANLVPFAAGDQFGSRQFALPPEMIGLQGLYASSKAAIVGNVGPLVEPVTRTSYRDETVRLPPRLFSHNDQTATWQAGGPEGTVTGWAGRFMDTLRSRNGAPEFSAVTTGAHDLFVTGDQVVPYQTDVDGAPAINVVQDREEGDAGEPWLEGLKQHFRGQSVGRRSLLERDVATLSRRSYDANVLYDQATQNVPPLSTVFAPDSLSAQLSAVVRAISARSSLSACRQVFVVEMGGFDTHSIQTQTLPVQQAILSSAIVAFQTAMEELGLERSVTLFTASEFGRTLAVNGDGTDHGWAGHQFVVGGAVNGGQVYGDVPEATFDHELDAGGGRLIPTLAVEQYAAPLGRWFGLSDSELQQALPNLTNFAGPLPAFV